MGGVESVPVADRLARRAARQRQHRQWQLAEALRGQGEQVLYPQPPDPDRPSVHNWLKLLDSELAQLAEGERVVIAHSLAVPLWLHAVSREPGVAQTDRVLLVSPPSPLYCPEGVEAAYPDLRLDTTIVPGGGHLD